MKQPHLRRSRVLMGCGALLALTTALPAEAGTVTVTFNFDNLCSYSGTACTGTNPAGSSQNAVSADIANYMTDVLKSAGFSVGSVTVTGAVGQQGNGNNGNGSYTASNNVVGPSGDPLTLGSTEGSTPGNNTVSQQDTGTGSSGTNAENLLNDGFIINCNGSDYTSYCSGQSDNISVQFNNLTMNGKQYEIASVNFDLQIFPDVTCQQLNSANCGGAQVGGHYPSQPDFQLLTSPSGTQLASTWWAVTPGTGGQSSFYTVSGGSNSEAAPQLLTNSGTINVASQVSNLTSLDFQDWPATIGIDNLVLTFSTGVPEPTTLILFGFGLLGLAGIMMRNRRAPSLA